MTEHTVHRILDQAFEGVELTPDVQDLKEEIRANLLARVGELEAQGRSTDDAVRIAVEEVGDLRAVVAEVAAASAQTAPGTWVEHERLTALHRVRARPAVVAGLVALSAVLAAGVVLMALDATGVVTMSPEAAVLTGLAAALAAGGITVLSLRQETTAHYPMPLARAVGWGGAAAAGTLAAATGAAFAADTSATGLLAATIVLAVVALGAVVMLAVTQTNRTKEWARDAATRSQDRFTQEPAAAARFGIYSAALWLAALAALVVIGLTLGWLWSWTPVVAALGVNLVLLARMQFPPERPGR